MASEPIRDPVKDQLLTPKNAALIIIDYQPVQVNSIASMDRQLLITNIVGVARIGLAYGLPIVTTRWRAVPELFPAAYPGLVEPRSPEQVAAALGHFMFKEQGTPLRQAFLDNYLEAQFTRKMKLALQTMHGE